MCARSVRHASTTLAAQLRYCQLPEISSPLQSRVPPTRCAINDQPLRSRYTGLYPLGVLHCKPKALLWHICGGHFASQIRCCGDPSKHKGGAPLLSKSYASSGPEAYMRSNCACVIIVVTVVVSRHSPKQIIVTNLWVLSRRKRTFSSTDPYSQSIPKGLNYLALAASGLV